VCIVFKTNNICKLSAWMGIRLKNTVFGWDFTLYLTWIMHLFPEKGFKLIIICIVDHWTWFLLKINKTRWFFTPWHQSSFITRVISWVFIRSVEEASNQNFIKCLLNLRFSKVWLVSNFKTNSLLIFLVFFNTNFIFVFFTA